MPTATPIRRRLSLVVTTIVATLLLTSTACGGGSTPPRETEPEYEPGTSYFGTNEYIEYIAGDLPLIFTAPHGGLLAPEDIPVRTEQACASTDFATVTDANTQDIARRIQQAFARDGRYPHVIINRLARSRLDANRSRPEGACGDPQAELAWTEYHEFVQAARAQVLEEFGRGFYTDLHGHGHAVQRLELGYTLSATTLRRTDAELDGDAAVEDASSIRVMSEQSPLSFSALLRGPTSLGTLFTEAGFPAVPSEPDPAPDVGEAYFSGGFNTDLYGCSTGGMLCGVQIEMNFTGVRDTPDNREAFANALRAVYAEYLVQFGIELP